MKLSEKKRVSVIIPCYNEERVLSTTVEKIRKFSSSAHKYIYSFIFVNDGSRDATEFYLNEDENTKVLRNLVNKGKGYSIKKGVLASCSDYIFFIDADLSIDIEYIDKMVDILEETDFDIIIGERDLGSRSLLRKITSKYCNKIVIRELPLLKDIKDTQCGLKGFKADIAKHLFKNLKEYGFSFDIEILYNAVREGRKIYPFKVIYSDSRMVESSVNIFIEPYRFYKSIKRIKNG